MKTRKQYMDKEVGHHAYFSQFVTEATKRYVLKSLSVEQIKEALSSGDTHLNKIKIPFNNMDKPDGNWWWDYAPVNRELIGECGESFSKSTVTCIAKAAAKMLALEPLEGGDKGCG